MKIICAEDNYCEKEEDRIRLKSREPVLYTKNDTCILKDNEAFYYPDFSNDISARCGLAVRINHIGKSITEKYADGFYKEFLLAVEMTCMDLLEKEKRNSLSWTLSKGFDYSLVVSDCFDLKTTGIDLRNLSFAFCKNGQKIFEMNSSCFVFSVQELIAYISRYVTLKVGDLLFVGFSPCSFTVSTGDIFSMEMNGENVLECEIK